MDLLRKLPVGVFTVAAAASVVGIAGYNNYRFPLFQQQTAVAQTVQQAQVLSLPKT